MPPADEADLATGDELSFRRPHISEAVLLKLRRGHFVVEAEIDLHGMTGAEAKAALREFILQAVNRRMSCVRIIHGKGRRSGPRGPVLKNVVTSSTKSSGCSNAAKCPPRGIVVKCVTL